MLFERALVQNLRSAYASYMGTSTQVGSNYSHQSPSWCGTRWNTQWLHQRTSLCLSRFRQRQLSSRKVSSRLRRFATIRWYGALREFLWSSCMDSSPLTKYKYIFLHSSMYHLYLIWHQEKEQNIELPT